MNEQISAIIVEDEKEGLENLVIKLKKACPQISVVAKCQSGEAAIQSITELKPDIVFLDVRLGGMTGFDVLNKLPFISFELIFTTGYDEYAIDAIKVNAIDYLIKPIKTDELFIAVSKAKIRVEEKNPIKRISVPINNGFQFIPIDDIIYCLADDSYTKIYRNDLPMVMVTKTLKFIQYKLPSKSFFRISRSAVINLEYVDSFRRSNGGLVFMKNNHELSVSRDQRNELLNRLTN